MRDLLNELLTEQVEKQLENSEHSKSNTRLKKLTDYIVEMSFGDLLKEEIISVRYSSEKDTLNKEAKISLKHYSKKADIAVLITGTIPILNIPIKAPLATINKNLSNYFDAQLGENYVLEEGNMVVPLLNFYPTTYQLRNRNKEVTSIEKLSIKKLNNFDYINNSIKRIGKPKHGNILYDIDWETGQSKVTDEGWESFISYTRDVKKFVSRVIEIVKKYPNYDINTLLGISRDFKV